MNTLRRPNDWTLRQRFIHWRLRAARRALYPTILYRRTNPAAHAAAKAREDRWTRRWIATFTGKVAR